MRIPLLHALRPSPTFLPAFLPPLGHSCFFGVHGPQPNAYPCKYPSPSFAVPGKSSLQNSPPPWHLSRCPVRSPCWIDRQEGARLSLTSQTHGDLQRNIMDHHYSFYGVRCRLLHAGGLQEESKSSPPFLSLFLKSPVTKTKKRKPASHRQYPTFSWGLGTAENLISKTLLQPDGQWGKCMHSDETPSLAIRIKLNRHPV